MYNTVWYDNLIKPVFMPSAFVFKPVWIILYSVMVVSVVLYSISKYDGKKRGYLLFNTQLVFNLLWSPVFFGLRNINLALAVIIFLDVFTILTVKEFYKLSKPAAYLLIPYLIWILFATYLNLGLAILNC